MKNDDPPSVRRDDQFEPHRTVPTRDDAVIIFYLYIVLRAFSNWRDFGIFVVGVDTGDITTTPQLSEKCGMGQKMKIRAVWSARGSRPSRSFASVVKAALAAHSPGLGDFFYVFGSAVAIFNYNHYE